MMKTIALKLLISPVQRVSTLFILSAITCVSAYWPGLYGPMVQDDLNNLGFLLNSKLNFNDVASHIMSFSGQFGRPVAMLSFTINAMLSQDLFYWKLTNLGIHLICGVLIYFLIENILYFANSEKENNKPSLLALTVTSLWLLHPLHISTVLYTVQRMAQLSALFLFAGMLSYLVARKRQLASFPYVSYQLLTWCVLFPLALFSKENGILLPLFIVLFELFLIQRDRISNKLLNQLILGLTIVSFGIVFYKWDWINAGYGVKNYTAAERLLTESRIIMAYLGMLLIPIQSNMSFVHDDFIVSKGFFEPYTTVLSISFIALLIISAFYLRKNHPVYSLGVLFFFSGHLLESTIVPLELMYEHRNYQPSIGVFLAIAVIACNLLINKDLFRSLALLYLILFSFSTWLRADSWSSSYRFYFDLARFNPKSEQVAYLLSQQAANYGDYQRARTIMKPFESLGASFHLLSVDCADQKLLTDEQFIKVLKPDDLVDNYVINSLVKIANLGLEHKCNFNYNAFLSVMDGLLDQKNTSASNRQLIMMYKSHYLWHTNQKNKAISFLKETYAVNTENLTPLFLACEWSIDEKMPPAQEICPNVINMGKTVLYKYEDLTLKVNHRYNLYLSSIKEIGKNKKF